MTCKLPCVSALLWHYHQNIWTQSVCIMHCPSNIFFYSVCCCWTFFLDITYQQNLSNLECTMPLKHNTVAKVLVTIRSQMHIWYSWRDSSQPLLELEFAHCFNFDTANFDWLLCHKHCTVTWLNYFKYHYLNKMAVLHGYWHNTTNKYSATQCKRFTQWSIRELSHYSSIIKLKTVNIKLANKM
jgi:hypothetical protein